MAIWHLHHGASRPCSITLVSAPQDVKPSSDQRMPALVFVIALTGVVLHLSTGWRYCLFRDEFYYLACANHLYWGYVDHLPLSIFVFDAVIGCMGDAISVVCLSLAILYGASF